MRMDDAVIDLHIFLATFNTMVTEHNDYHYDKQQYNYGNWRTSHSSSVIQMNS